MRAPQQAYHFAVPKDVASPTFELVNRKVDAELGAASSSMELLNDLAKDRSLIITNASVRAIPDPLNLVTQIVIIATSGPGADFVIARAMPTVAVDVPVVLNWVGELYTLGGGEGTTSIRALIFFDGAGAANTGDANFSGIVIPRGNIANF